VSGISEMEMRSLEHIVSESQKLTEHPLPPPSAEEARLAFGLADDILDAVSNMRKSLARDKNIRDAQGLLRISAASVVYSQLLAIRQVRTARIAAAAPADKPMAFHTVTVECFHDGTFKTRVESGILKYDAAGTPTDAVDVHTYGPRGGRRSADQAAQDVIVGARMLSRAIVAGAGNDTSLHAVEGT